jgi:hypothetical protein
VELNLFNGNDCEAYEWTNVQARVNLMSASGNEKKTSLYKTNNYITNTIVETKQIDERKKQDNRNSRKKLVVKPKLLKIVSISCHVSCE